MGVTFIDTGHANGPDVAEQLIRNALHPYPDQTATDAPEEHQNSQDLGRWHASRTQADNA